METTPWNCPYAMLVVCVMYCSRNERRDQGMAIFKNAGSELLSGKHGRPAAWMLMLVSRLALLEDTLETFYFWFAVQKGPPQQPALPMHRLTGFRKTRRR